MREVLTLSLPNKTKEFVKKKAQRSGFANVSSYIQFLIQQDEEVISEAELLQSVKEAQKEYEAGKAIKAKSMAELV
jgi:Arc/MetJ-type ribon-helix-helix transcriptional regulator